MPGPGVLFWRMLYGALEMPWLQRLLQARYRDLEMTHGSGVARKFLRRTLSAIAANKLRAYQGYVPLQMWQAFWEISRGIDSAGGTTRRSPRARDGKLRIGLVGMIAYLPFYPRKLFCDLPPEMEIRLYETARDIPGDHYLRHTDARAVHSQVLRWNYELPALGMETQPEYAANVRELAARINRDELDLLLISEPAREIYDLLDAVDTPAIADLAATSNACFHPKLDLQFYIHATKDYVVKNDRLYCRASEKPLARPPFAREYCLLFDTTGYEGKPVPWVEREHVLFFHGRLVKAAQPAFLKMMLDLLEQDEQLALVLYGFESHGALEAIRSAARRRGLERRLDYRGLFTLQRNPEGEIIDPAWHRFVRDLRHAKLAPTSFPMASGCARFETYAAGVPCVNLGIRQDNRHWTAQDETLVDIPALYTPSATVLDLEAYRQVAQRLLTEEKFATQVIAEQAAVVERLGSPRFFWKQILDTHRDWLARQTA